MVLEIRPEYSTTFLLHHSNPPTLFDLIYGMAIYSRISDALS